MRTPPKHVVYNLTTAALFTNNCGAPIVATLLEPAPVSDCGLGAKKPSFLGNGVKANKSI